MKLPSYQSRRSPFAMDWDQKYMMRGMEGLHGATRVAPTTACVNAYCDRDEPWQASQEALNIC